MKFYWHHSLLLLLTLSMAALTETIWPTKSKIFPIWSFSGKWCWPLTYSLFKIKITNHLQIVFFSYIFGQNMGNINNLVLLFSKKLNNWLIVSSTIKCEMLLKLMVRLGIVENEQFKCFFSLFYHLFWKILHYFLKPNNNNYYYNYNDNLVIITFILIVTKWHFYCHFPNSSQGFLFVF